MILLAKVQNILWSCLVYGADEVGCLRLSWGTYVDSGSVLQMIAWDLHLDVKVEELIVTLRRVQPVRAVFAVVLDVVLLVVGGEKKTSFVRTIFGAALRSHRLRNIHYALDEGKCLLGWYSSFRLWPSFADCMGT